MNKIAVDIALLPDEKMTEIAIKTNRELAPLLGQDIVLNKENCLPHISLAMGCIDKKDIDAVRDVLAGIAGNYHAMELRVIGISIAANAKGQKITAFAVERTSRLQSLHEEVMNKLSGYLTADVTTDMVNAQNVADSTLNWIKNYAHQSAFAGFLPHITIGYGQLDQAPKPIGFAAGKLALCHLGNHCTCSKILAAINLL